VERHVYGADTDHAGRAGISHGTALQDDGGAVPPRYIALYKVDSAAVFESARYKSIGGGGTWSARFRPAYQVWIRNLFETEAAVPAVGDDEAILVFDAAKPGRFPPATQKPLWLKSVGLHRTTPYRALAVLSAAAAKAAATSGQGICYRPVTSQLK
jgi:hypothetical protein